MPTDGHTDDERVPAPEAPPVVDDWASAFATLEEKPPVVAPDDASDSAGEPAGGQPAAETTQPTTEPAGDGGDALLGSGDDGGTLPAGAGDGTEGTGDAPVDIDATIAGYSKAAEERALEETAKLFLERADESGNKLIRQTEGRLGATINDPDIYRVDPATGAASFYNPDTGLPFTGDNPRAQAKAWVDAYNDELKDTFNRLAETRQAQLEQEMAPAVELLRFSPVYEGLDPIRQRMLDAIIEDYEVYDAEGTHIGYSIDLNKALAQVNKQVAAVQAARESSQQEAQPPAVAPAPAASGPALDMPNSGSGGSGGKPEFKSLSEAMEYEQTMQLEKMRKK